MSLFGTRYRYQGYLGHHFAHIQCITGHALNRETQLPEIAASVGGTSGIWAPALREHNGTFYLLTTLVQDKKADNDSSRWDNVRTPDL